MTKLFEVLSGLYHQKEISLYELEFGRFLSQLEPEALEEEILLGMACIKNQMEGHLCLKIDDFVSNTTYSTLLDEKSLKQVSHLNLANAKLVGTPGESKPLILEKDKLYLQKLWKYEDELCKWLIQKTQKNTRLSNDTLAFIDGLFQETDKFDWQKIAVKLSLIKDLVIISGGPGTGKTFIIKKIIEALLFSSSSIPRIALAAPTGKAAQRLNETLELDKNEPWVQQAVTVHKLLGAEFESSNFKYNSANKLAYDVVIIDEASMLDIHLWTGLIRAVLEGTKIILLGDKNQLSSVEAGSIIGDICSESNNSFSEEVFPNLNEKFSTNSSTALNDSIVLLKKTYRVKEESGIKILSDAINNGDALAAIELLKSDQFPEVSLVEPSSQTIEELINDFVLKAGLENHISEIKIENINAFKILCALRKGPFGVEEINKRAERSLKRGLGISINQQWYQGRPIMMIRSNNQLKVKNGEVGVCIQKDNGFEVLFDRSDELKISASRMQDYELGFANTIHKSQGSEYDHIAILLSNEVNPILSRELFYTAVTRARKSIRVIGNEELITATVKKIISRNSGIRAKIWRATL